MTIRAPPSLATLWRSPGLSVSSVPGPASTTSRPASMRVLPSTTHQPGPFANLVVAKLLTGAEADDDRPRPVDGLETAASRVPSGA